MTHPKTLNAFLDVQFISRNFEQYAIYTMQDTAPWEIKKNETSFKQLA